MKEKTETVFEAVNFFRRRIQPPLYAGLIVRGVQYADRFTKGLVHFCLTIKGIGVSVLMLGVLTPRRKNSVVNPVPVFLERFKIIFRKASKR